MSQPRCPTIVPTDCNVWVSIKFCGSFLRKLHTSSTCSGSLMGWFGFSDLSWLSEMRPGYQTSRERAIGSSNSWMIPPQSMNIDAEANLVVSEWQFSDSTLSLIRGSSCGFRGRCFGSSHVLWYMIVSLLKPVLQLQSLIIHLLLSLTNGAFVYSWLWQMNTCTGFTLSSALAQFPCAPPPSVSTNAWNARIIAGICTWLTRALLTEQLCWRHCCADAANSLQADSH